jgi:hypothetical protein
MVVCILSLSSVSEGAFLLCMLIARYGILLLQILRVRTLALDSGVPLNLWLLFLLLFISRSFAFVVCGSSAWLLVQMNTSEACSPDITNGLHEVSKAEGGDDIVLESGLKEALVDRFLTRVSGQQKVGEEDDSGHRNAYHPGW